MKKENISVLALGDRTDFDSFAKFKDGEVLLKERGFEYRAVNYRSLLRGKLPALNNEKVIVFMFFPFSYWDRYIEKKGYRGLYGNVSFARRFARFWRRVKRIIAEKLPDKKIMFVNVPELNGRYRDKLSVKRKLEKAGVRQARLYRTDDTQRVLKLLDKGHRLFIKPRCGSMGKGITYMTPSEWYTNFLFRKNRIVSKIADYGWTFRRITGNEKFLKKLVNGDMLIEEAINPLVLNGSIVDLRIYVFLNKVIYVYPRRNEPMNIVTNISQGAKGDPSILRFLPKEAVKKSKKLAVRTSRTLGLSLCGIDIMISDNRRDVFVVDVNLFPGFPARKRFDLTGSMIRELTKARDKGRLHFEKASDI